MPVLSDPFKSTPGSRTGLDVWKMRKCNHSGGIFVNNCSRRMAGVVGSVVT